MVVLVVGVGMVEFVMEVLQLVVGVIEELAGDEAFCDVCKLVVTRVLFL